MYVKRIPKMDSMSYLFEAFEENSSTEDEVNKSSAPVKNQKKKRKSKKSKKKHLQPDKVKSPEPSKQQHVETMNSLCCLYNKLLEEIPTSDTKLASEDDVDKSSTLVKSPESRKRLHSDDESSPDQPKQKKEALQQQNDLTHSGKENISQSERLGISNTINESNDKHIVNSNVCNNEIKMHTVEALEKCVHEVALPPHMDYTPLVKPTKLLKDYKFTLDPFQKEAIMCIENNESVLVSAHTSAGKTVVGEYSILKSLNLKQRVVYTTPIKALSNQKYREFQEQFQDVGLITGDVTINPSASCLIMTTEILRNMLYKGSEIMREVAWVIFDEIHYMRDLERGVVWEEALILLPDNVHYVFLSATIPNARQFAQWIVHIHKQPVHVVYTDVRPTPLQHFIFPVGSSKMFLVVDENDKFDEQKFENALKIVSNPTKGKKVENQRKANRFDGKEDSILKLVSMVIEKNLAPVLIFSFSKKDCEIYAMQMCKMNLNTPEEKILVDEVFRNAMAVLSEEDRNLPQVVNVLPLLRRGIGIHHGGLLPILKETIEVLFSEGLIKALFATETFAMGLNMPAKSVIFTSIKKFDGKNLRRITSGEYIQMSGRAGRRGLDENGTVIVMLEEPLSVGEGKELLQGKADPLNSAFHLAYNMLLNIIKVEDINPEYLLERSFFQFQNRDNLSNLQEEYNKLESKISEITVENESTIESYYSLKQVCSELNKEYQAFTSNPKYLKQFLSLGRLAKVSNKNEEDLGWGVILNYRKEKKKRNPVKKKDQNLIIDLFVKVDSSSSPDNPKPCLDGRSHKMIVISLPNHRVAELSSVRIHVSQNLKSSQDRLTAQIVYDEVVKRFKGDFPILDPVKHMKIEEDRFIVLIDQINAINNRMSAHAAHDITNLPEILQMFEKKQDMRYSLKNIKNEIIKSMSLLQMEELNRRKRVLRRLKFCTEADVIELKGRVAAEISCADELILTEMFFNGLFTKLSSQQLAALLSCFVCDEKSNMHTKVSGELAKPLHEAKEIARWIVKVSQEAKVDISEDTYIDQIKPYLMDIVYLWCNGSSFHEICQKTDIFEGGIIRCFRRLEKLLQQLMQAAKALGNHNLEVKFSESICMLKRDIVFAASLYL